jgi:hypothetical protein
VEASEHSYFDQPNMPVKQIGRMRGDCPYSSAANYLPGVEGLFIPPTQVELGTEIIASQIQFGTQDKNISTWKD